MAGTKFEEFQGFSQETLNFLQNLYENNNKPWFEEHRSVYEQHLLGPMKKLVNNLSEFMLDIDPDIEVRPAINKTISKIYRDTRFSKDKSLFRCNMWLVFKRPNKNWQDAPGFFFEIFQDWYRYGMGYYTASRKSMDTFRELIDDDPDEFLKIISFHNKYNIYELQGDKYKRLIPCDHSEEIQNWYQRKNFYLVCNRKADDVLFSPKLLEILLQGFDMLAPLYQMLLKVRMKVYS